MRKQSKCYRSLSHFLLYKQSTQMIIIVLNALEQSLERKFIYPKTVNKSFQVCGNEELKEKSSSCSIQH